MPRIVIAGGGIAGLEALVALRAHLGPQPEIELLEANAALVERQETVAEPFDARGPRRFDLHRIANDHHVALRRDRLASMIPTPGAFARSRAGPCDTTRCSSPSGGGPTSACPAR